MENIFKELTLDDLNNEDFFNSIKEEEFILVLGAGFSFGLKNKSKSDFDDERYIPVVEDFIKMTSRRFSTSIPMNNFQTAADQWQRHIANSDIEFSDFKNLFLLDEEEFIKENKNLYSNILVPKWSRIYTFNFDNVLDVLVKDKRNDYEIQYYDVGSFSSANKTGIGYLHNSILEANKISDLVFTNLQYANKILHPNNHLYYSLFNDVEKHKKNILIIGCGFVEQSVYTYVLSQITRVDLKIIHINFKDKPQYELDFENKVNDISWINCKAKEFLNFISTNLEKISKQDFLPKYIAQIKRSQSPSLNEESKVLTFNDFLNSEYLEYFSRRKFKSKILKETGNEFQTESDFLNQILENKFYGLVIHGQGGIGKTRLMLELGISMIDEDFIALKVLADFENFDELISYFNRRPNQKYLLLFDYIEEQKTFEKIVKWIISNNIDNVKLIGNCRNTIVSDIQYSFYEYLKFIDIGIKSKTGVYRKTEQDYKRAVVKSIINSIPDKSLSAHLNYTRLKSFYQSRPSFAAFIKYIYLKNPDETLSIATNDNFSSWLIKKLKQTTNKNISYSEFFEKKKYIFQILLCLPSSANSTIKLVGMNQGEICFADEINKLIQDGWIDTNGGTLRVVHDTITDSLLIEYLNHFQFHDYYLIKLLEFAESTDCISSLLWSIQRVWEEFLNENILKFQKCIAKFLDSNLNENNVQEFWFKYKIYTSHLLSEEDRIILFIKHKHVLKENFALEKFGSSLAYSMGWVYENISDLTKKRYYSDNLKELYFNFWNINGRHNSFINDPRNGKIISCYINLFGIDDHIKDRFLEYCELVLCNTNNLEHISFAVVSWLNHDGDASQEVINLITSWFEVYEKVENDTVNRSYIINSCITRDLTNIIPLKYIVPTIQNLINTFLFLKQELYNKNISPELKIIVIEWFEIYEKEKPSYLCPIPLAINWIKCDGDTTIVMKSVIGWLDENNDSIKSVFELGDYLYKIPKKTALKELEASAQVIFNNYSTSKEIGYCIGYWIYKGGNLLIVEPFVNSWLNNFGLSEIGVLIITNWLDKKGNCLVVKNFIAPCLSFLGTQIHANYLMKSWLKWGNDPFIIQEYIIEFFKVKENQEFLYCGELISIWLEKTNSSQLIKDAVISWLAANGKNLHSLSVCRFWLEKGKDTDVVENYIINDLTYHSSDKRTYKVLLLWLMLSGKPDPIKLSINGYLKSNWKELGSIEVIKELIKLNFCLDEISIYIFMIVNNLGYNPFNELILTNDNKIFNKLNPKFKIELCESEKEAGKLSYRIENHLLCRQSPDLIKKDVLEFLTKYGLESFASFVISSWLEYGNDFNFIKHFLISWLEKHLLVESYSSFVLSNALETESGFEVVHDKTIEWLKKYGKTKEAKFPLSSWLKLKGNEGAEEIEVWIIYWFENFYDIEDGNWRDDLLLNFALDRKTN